VEEAARVAANGVSRRDYTQPRRYAAREWWEEVVPRMDDKRYVRNFRVPRSVMNEIIERAEQHPWFQVAQNNVGRAISTAKKVSMAIWRLGRSATIGDCSELFGMSEGLSTSPQRRCCSSSLTNSRTVFGAVSSVNLRIFVATAVHACFLQGYRRSHDSDAWTKIAKGFEERTGFPNCGGAGDGVLLPIYYVTGTDPADYYSRKGFYALNFSSRSWTRLYDLCTSVEVSAVQCMMGMYGLARRLERISRLAERCPKASTSLLTTVMWYVYNQLVSLPALLFLVVLLFQGDAQLLTSFTKPKNAELPPAERRYNYLHSLTRGVVERAFGILKARFRWMLRGIQLRSLESYNRWFMASCILHNMCLDAGCEADVVPPAGSHADGFNDNDFGGLVATFSHLSEAGPPGNREFSAAVARALDKRTAEALRQATYGLTA